MGRPLNTYGLAPWHAESYERFLTDGLPSLLALRVPLAGYSVKPADDGTRSLLLVIGGAAAQAMVLVTGVPWPSPEGVFDGNGARRVVVPTASSNALSEAEVRCVGEQMLDYVSARLGEAPAGMEWDEALARAWLPLDRWIGDFLKRSETAQVVDSTNWLSERTHLRRLIILGDDRSVHPDHLGRVCPYEKPEGPNIGKVVTIARGARVVGGRLVPAEQPLSERLAIAASFAPLIEHSDPVRLLMGCNMMRQWIPPDSPEPALVRTGSEPDEPGVWCGRNLLTAYMSLGEHTHEDALVVSESCAARLGYPEPLEPGDKLSNRHGQKGVISAIWPDAEMPCLPDGRAVDLVVSFVGVHTRLNFGQIREAVLGRIAQTRGEAVVVAPCEGPKADELRALLREAGLPEDGMEQLTLWRGGPALARRTTVGWVYWGKTVHRAGEKLHCLAGPRADQRVRAARGQRQGVMEYCAMREVGAYENIRECLNVREESHPDAATLADRLAIGPMEQSAAPSPQFQKLVGILDAAGIRAELRPEGVSFRFERPSEPRLELARPVRHPWISTRELTDVGRQDDLAEFRALEEANRKLARLVETRAPESLLDRAHADVADAVRRCLNALLTRYETQPGGRCLYSGRAVLAPGAGLAHDEASIPDEMAWVFFGPLAARRLGDTEAVAARTAEAVHALDAVMAESWILINRAPSLETTNILAFRPRRAPERVIRIPALACPLMNADHDGDQVAVLLPVTEAAQREAPRTLSIAAQLTRAPRPNYIHGAPPLRFLDGVCPTHEAAWGLAELGRTEAGLREISDLAGAEVHRHDGLVTRASLVEAVQTVMHRDGPEAALAAVDRLTRRGFEVARLSGASISPFLGEALDTSGRPESDDASAWRRCSDELLEQLTARDDVDNDLVGPQLMLVRIGARGNASHLCRLIGTPGTVRAADGAEVVLRHSYHDGLTPEELLANVPGAITGLLEVNLAFEGVGRAFAEEHAPKGLHVLARAWCARRPWRGTDRRPHPGVVFARAAALEETDPLEDVDSRLFVGLPVA